MSWLMHLLDLFWTFFKIGLFTFGGGYAMIPIMQSEVVSKGWLGYDEVIRFIAISESTPGPFAINMATFIGSSQMGIVGSLVATIGVVLPSFIVILLIAAIFKTFENNRYVKAALRGVKPVIVALIAATGVILVLRNFAPNFPAFDGNFDYRSLIIMIDAAIIYWGYRIVIHKKMSPVRLILFAAILGMLIYI